MVPAVVADVVPAIRAAVVPAFVAAVFALVTITADVVPCHGGSCSYYYCSSC